MMVTAAALPLTPCHHHYHHHHHQVENEACFIIFTRIHIENIQEKNL
jgi:hypothetical protein